MDMEVCCTLGMLTPDQVCQMKIEYCSFRTSTLTLSSQALKLKDAGLTAYNHNLDTSREFYPEVISTRTYDDRLQTLEVGGARADVACIVPPFTMTRRLYDKRVSQYAAGGFSDWENRMRQVSTADTRIDCSDILCRTV